MSQERLQKIIAASGLMSRRKAEEAILEGRVTVNGELITALGSKANPDQDEIKCDGFLLPKKKEEITVAFYKPRNIITSKGDPQGRKTVMDFFPERLQTLNPVGRLDFDSEGLLILSTQGDLIQKLTHPKYQIPKIYQVGLQKEVSPENLQTLTEKVELEDGPGKFAGVKFLKKLKRSFLYEVYVLEGRNRFIRRMWSALGYEVLRLKRTQIGNITLGSLKSGEHRLLNTNELQELEVLASKV